MKIFIDFIDGKYYGKHLDVVDQYVLHIAGKDAMMILFNKDDCEYHKDQNLIVLYNRSDFNFKIKTCDSGMGVDTFADNKFSWYCVDKEYLFEELEKQQ